MRASLVMQGAQHAPATLVRLREERLRSRRQATVECGLLAVLGIYAAVKMVAPGLLVGSPQRRAVPRRSLAAAPASSAHESRHSP
jgi:hypothetical protein